VAALAGLGIPVNADGREYTYALLHESEKPKLLLSGARDEFASPRQLQQIFDAAAEPKRLVVIPDADHFFAGHLDEMRNALSLWVREIVGPAALHAL
jgi:alpha/beta superfamily hydrolase